MPTLPNRIFHIADAANYSSIVREGLLSTAALRQARRFDPDLDRQVRDYRPTGVVLPDSGYIRDQSPMPPAALAPCLDAGLAPQDWYDLVNQGIYFWADPKRVDRHLDALRGRPQVVLAIDAPALLRRYGEVAFVTAFNVGNARRRPAPRGTRSFVPLRSWQQDGWRAEALPGGPVRPSRHPPAEIVIRAAIPDIAAYVADTRHLPARDAEGSRPASGPPGGRWG